MESRLKLPDVGEEQWTMTTSEHEISARGDENILELDGGDICTTF